MKQGTDRQKPESILSTEQGTRPKLPTAIRQRQQGTGKQILENLLCQK